MKLERMIKKKEPRASQRILAANMMKNKAFLTKYDMIEARMKGVKIQ